jgi:hypothetical protein
VESEIDMITGTAGRFRVLLLVEGPPDPASPGDGARDCKLPWPLEEEFRGSGGGIFFLAAKPDQNFEEPNAGYAEYGFPLAESTQPYISRSSGDKSRSRWDYLAPLAALSLLAALPDASRTVLPGR